MSKPQLFQSKTIFHLSQEARSKQYCKLHRGGEMWTKKEVLFTAAKEKPQVLCYREQDMARFTLTFPGQKCSVVHTCNEFSMCLGWGWEWACSHVLPLKPRLCSVSRGKGNWDLTALISCDGCPNWLPGSHSQQGGFMASAAVIRAETTKSFNC